jgi:hypothetical protein
MALCPYTDNLAFSLGPSGKFENKSAMPGPKQLEKQAYMLKIKNNVLECTVVPDSRSVSAMTWYPIKSRHELLVVAGDNSPLSIFTATVTEDIANKASYLLNDGIIVSNIAWNPSGDTIALNLNLFGTGAGRCLGVSYDYGKNVVVTNIPMNSYYFVWLAPDTLCIENRGDILEIKTDGKNPRIERTLYSGEEIRLFGELKGNVVYSSGNKVYCGARLLFTSDKKVPQGKVSDSYVAIRTGEEILILDEDGNIISRKDVGQVSFVGFSSTSGFVYTMKNYRFIQRYKFTEDSQIHTVFDAEWIEDDKLFRTTIPL